MGREDGLGRTSENEGEAKSWGSSHAAHSLMYDARRCAHPSHKKPALAHPALSPEVPRTGCPDDRVSLPPYPTAQTLFGPAPFADLGQLGGVEVVRGRCEAGIVEAVCGFPERALRGEHGGGRQGE
jgi:hypothetical protein